MSDTSFTSLCVLLPSSSLSPGHQPLRGSEAACELGQGSVQSVWYLYVRWPLVCGGLPSRKASFWQSDWTQRITEGQGLCRANNIKGYWNHIIACWNCVSLLVQTRILVTHGVSFLPFVDEIVVLVDGVVSEVGSYKSLRNSKGAFSEFIDTYAKEQNNQTSSESGNLFFHSISSLHYWHSELLGYYE